MLILVMFYSLVLTFIYLFTKKTFSCCEDKATVVLNIVGIILVLSAIMIFFFKINFYGWQIYLILNFSPFSSYLHEFEFGFDGLSIYFFFLSTLLIFICVLFCWNENNFNEYAANLILIELFLLIVFSTLDLFIFYVFFEAILIPMFFLIGIFGSRERKIRAVYLFFFYTFCGSLLFLFSLLRIYALCGTLNIEYLINWSFNFNEEIFFWFFFFLSFASKIPMFPFHIWLPEAHVEAPTVGSVLLAGILLKLGVFGFLRFSILLFPNGSVFFTPLIYLLSVLGVIYASLTAIRQTDMKRIVAYSSIAHMNMVTLGIFSFNSFGIQGSIIQSLSHGFVASGMFILIGVLYDRYHTRFLYYFGGLIHTMPLFSSLLLLFTLSNIALPGTSSFIGEFLLLLGIFQTSAFTCILGALGIILSGSYSLWMYNRIVFGNIKLNYTVKFLDITKREFFILLPLFLFILILGICPSFISGLFAMSVWIF